MILTNKQFVGGNQSDYTCYAQHVAGQMACATMTCATYLFNTFSNHLFYNCCFNCSFTPKVAIWVLFVSSTPFSC